MKRCYSVSALFFFTISAHASAFPELNELKGVRYSALVVNLNTRKVIAEKNADKRLSPASVTKLVIGAKALDTWGADKTFTTRIFMRGSLSNGVLDGDLVFYGTGDPSLTNEKLWFLTTDVARYGIKKVTGKLIVNNSYFGSLEVDRTRESRKFKSHNAYDAPLSSSSVNFSVLAVVAQPGQKAGSLAQLSFEPYEEDSIKITGKVTTTAANIPAQVAVTRTTRTKNGDVYSVSGHVPVGSEAVRVYRSVSNPDRYAAETVNAFLEKAGIAMSGLVAVESSPLKKNDQIVAQVSGYPLGFQLKGLFQMSNNFIADMLTLDLLAANDNHHDLSLADSGKALEDYLGQIVKNSSWNPRSNGARTPIRIESGSGLTPENRLSARDVVSLLDYMYFNSREFPAYLDALPFPNGNGTLKKRFSTARNTEFTDGLRAKTGTLSEPELVVSLAGYSRLKNGDWVAFAIITNGFGVLRQSNLRSAIDMDLAQLLSAEP